MDRVELLQRVNRYRDLAAHMMDEQTCEGLLNLAKRYEALGSEVEKGMGDTDD